MKKIYAPLGFSFNIAMGGKDYLNGDSVDEVREFVLGMAELPDDVIEQIKTDSLPELIKILTDNGFEVEED